MASTKSGAEQRKALLLEARAEQVRFRMIPALAQSTLQTYQLTVERMYALRQVDLANKCTARVTRAATRRLFEHVLLQARSEGSLIKAYLRLNHVRFFLDRKEKGKSTEGFRQFLERENYRVFGTQPAEVRRRKPRTDALKGLSADWREQMLQNLSTEIPRAAEVNRAGFLGGSYT